jgi:hypothetical protein
MSINRLLYWTERVYFGKIAHGVENGGSCRQHFQYSWNINITIGMLNLCSIATTTYFCSRLFFMATVASFHWNGGQRIEQTSFHWNEGQRIEQWLHSTETGGRGLNSDFIPLKRRAEDWTVTSFHWNGGQRIERSSLNREKELIHTPIKHLHDCKYISRIQVQRNAETSGLNVQA